MSDAFYIKVDRHDINFINRIMEGYEYLGVVTTVKREEGILMIRVTSDTYAEVKNILQNLPVQVAFIKSI
jgi:hypothetical protein